MFHYNQCHKGFNLLCVQGNPQINLAFSSFSYFLLCSFEVSRTEVYLPAGILTLSPILVTYTDLTWSSNTSTLF